MRWLRKPISLLAVGLFVQLFLPAPAAAQFGFVENIFKKIDHLNLYYGPDGRFTRRADVRAGDDFRVLGFEANFGLDSGGCALISKCDSAAEPAWCRDGIKCTGKATVRHGDTVYELDYDGRGKDKSVDLWEISLAISYSQMSGFENRRHSDSLVLSGAFEQVPELGLYANLNFTPYTAVYTGVRMGLARLLNFQAAVDSGMSGPILYHGSGSTFVLEWALGVAADVHLHWFQLPMSVFAEVDFSYRDFPSVQWDVSGGTEVPAVLPTRLRASGRYVLFGIEFSL